MITIYKFKLQENKTSREIYDTLESVKNFYLT